MVFLIDYDYMVYTYSNTGDKLHLTGPEATSREAFNFLHIHFICNHISHGFLPWRRLIGFRCYCCLTV